MSSFFKDVEAMEVQRIHLKDKAPYFPSIHTERKEGVLYATTLVRFKNGDKWYTTHLVDSIKPTGMIGMPQLLKNIVYKAYSIHHLFVHAPNFGTELDVCQLEEKERLRNIIDLEN